MILNGRAKFLLGLIIALMLIAFSLQCALAASQASRGAADSASPRILGFNLSFSSSSEAGNWTVDHLIACDGPGNCKRLNGTAAEALGFPTRLVLKKSAQNENWSQDSSQSQPLLEPDDDMPPAQNNSIYLDPNELRGWASTDKRFSAQRKIIINSVFNRPSICWT